MKKDYRYQGFSTLPCADQYALAYERSLFLSHRGRLGFIVPVSLLSTDGTSKASEHSYFLLGSRPLYLFKPSDGFARQSCSLALTKTVLCIVASWQCKQSSPRLHLYQIPEVELSRKKLLPESAYFKVCYFQYLWMWNQMKRRLLALGNLATIEERRIIGTFESNASKSMFRKKDRVSSILLLARQDIGRKFLDFVPDTFATERETQLAPTEREQTT